jgi:hypothetical protein
MHPELGARTQGDSHEGGEELKRSSEQWRLTEHVLLIPGGLDRRKRKSWFPRIL